MKLKTDLLALLCLFVGVFSLHAQSPTTVYTATCGSQYYRIPAIATANNGDLIFVNDDRKNSNNDVGRRDNTTNGIDLLVKRLTYNSTSNSYATSFSSMLNITPSANKPAYYYCYGDPAVVADRESSNVLILTVGGQGASTSVWYKNKSSYVIKSTDNGQTWGSPIQVSLPTITDNSSVTGFFFASGRILQSKVIKKHGSSFYRIYSALLYTTNSAGGGPNYNKVFYSDDFGTTWNLLGTTYAQTSADEAKLEELPNGDVIITTRKGGGRYINKFTYTNTETAAGSWGSYGSSYAFTAGCAINGDMLTLTAYRISDNQEVTLLLQSTATGSSRTDIKIFYREIDNNTTVSNLVASNSWTASATLPNTAVFGGYSAMTLQADEKIGVYYEGNTTTCSNANDYSNLYYIVYTLEQLTGNAYTLTNPNPPTVPDVEVPDGIVPVYQWQGTYSDRWSDPQNWTVVNAVNNTPLARGMVPPTPDANSNVQILAPEANEYNPVLEAPLDIKNLYVAPGAAIGNQYWLRISEKVYTDVEIPTNQWVRMSMPLRDTYSGDMYTTTQGGVIPTDNFTGATYNPTSGNSGNNRVFPYSIYQRVFSDAVNVMTDDQTGTELHQLNSSWSVPYNDLAAVYQVGVGFDLWAPSTEAVATFRFPSETNEYAYYYSNGNPSTRTETVNHTASGEMAYGFSGKGVLDVTIKRAKRANGEGEGVPMYAVGNPSFSYLDIAEFIRVNAYGASHEGNASVVGNITPYAYKYNEGEDLDSGEASETIYYLDNDKNLYTVSASVSNTAMPEGGSTAVAANSTEKYVAPTRGFRVMAGQAEVSAIEPKLIGNYNTSTFKLAGMRYATNSSMTNASANTHFYVSSVPNSATGEYSSTVALTVAVGSTPDEVVIAGFCHSSILHGKVDPVSRTITVQGGSPVGYQFEGLESSGATWKSPTGNGANNRKIFAWDGTKAVSTSTIGGYYVEYATGLNPDAPIVFDYIVSSDGSVTISSQTGFVIYTGNGECPLSYMYLSTAGRNYPLALNAYESFTTSAMRESYEANYINPEMFGTYKYSVVSNYGTPGVTPSMNSLFTIAPIEGSYNVVRISNFFAGTATTKDDIMGYITENNGTYKLTIPGAQVVANGTSADFADYYGFYTRGRGGDVVLNWNAANKQFQINNYNSDGTIQISGFDANPNGTTFLGYYASGINPSGTTTSTVSTVTEVADLLGVDLLLYSNNRNRYLSVSNNGTVASNTTQNTAISTASYHFMVEASENEGKYYLKRNSTSSPYMTCTGNNTSIGWGSKSNATEFTLSYNDGWYFSKEGAQYPNLYMSSNSAISMSQSYSTKWTIYRLDDTYPSGQYIPQTSSNYSTAPGSSSTTGDFSVGTNYEAINLKFTAAMFNANPGKTPSASSAPRKTAAHGGVMASVTLTDGNRTANTLITKRENASNGFNAFEDASLIDVNDNAKSIATLAGNQMVAVNTLGDTTAVQLVINNANGNVALTFDNLDALGSNARLLDATTGVQTPLNGSHQELTVNMTANDSPLRYSIVWDVVSGTEDVELPMEGDMWFKALSTAKGTIKVISNENMTSVRLFDSTGKLVSSKINASNETMFEYLLSGIYVVEVSNGAETQSMKVNVK